MVVLTLVVLGKPVKARKLLADAVYGPAELKIIGKAFDDAWHQVAPLISKRAQAIEAARLKLAEMMLALAKNGNHDAQQLTEQAVKLMLANQSSAIRKI